MFEGGNTRNAPGNPMSSLLERRGERPQTHKAMPHQQMSQNAPSHLQEALFERARVLPGVQVGPSRVSVPGARAFLLDAEHAQGPPNAFMVGAEFAHLHPSYDGSLHLVLPREMAQVVIDKGWGEPHPMAAFMADGATTPLMVYGPQDEEEMEVVWSILRTSYTLARGKAGVEA